MTSVEKLFCNFTYAQQRQALVFASAGLLSKAKRWSLIATIDSSSILYLLFFKAMHHIERETAKQIGNSNALLFTFDPLGSSQQSLDPEQ